MEINHVQVRMGSALSLQPSSQPLAFEDKLLVKQNVQADNDNKDAAVQPEMVKFNASYFYTPGPAATKQTEDAHTARIMDIFIGDLPKYNKRLKRQLIAIENTFAEKMPEITGKRWDFSIDENGRAVVISQDISQTTKDRMATLINKMDVDHEFGRVRDLMLEAVAKERGSDAFSHGIGRFDLTKRNFSEVVYFKDYLAQSGSDNAYTSSAFFNQLDARAEVVFNKITKVDFQTQHEVDLYV